MSYIDNKRLPLPSWMGTRTLRVTMKRGCRGPCEKMPRIINRAAATKRDQLSRGEAKNPIRLKRAEPRSEVPEALLNTATRIAHTHFTQIFTGHLPQLQTIPTSMHNWKYFCPLGCGLNILNSIDRFVLRYHLWSRKPRGQLGSIRHLPVVLVYGLPAVLLIGFLSSYLYDWLGL